MAVVPNAYCGIEDLMCGDIPLSGRHGDGSPMIKATAEEIDAMIGHIYITPVNITVASQYRPSVLILKKINSFLASGRLLMDMAAAGEDHETQAYARRLLDEAWALLNKIACGELNLPGFEKVAVENGPGSKAAIYNEDEYSLVEAYYRDQGVSVFYGVEPYSSERVS